MALFRLSPADPSPICMAASLHEIPPISLMDAHSSTVSGLAKWLRCDLATGGREMIRPLPQRDALDAEL